MTNQYRVLREWLQPGVEYWICEHSNGPKPNRCAICVADEPTRDPPYDPNVMDGLAAAQGLAMRIEATRMLTAASEPKGDYYTGWHPESAVPIPNCQCPKCNALNRTSPHE